MSDSLRRLGAIREPWCLILEWADPVRNESDPDAPWCFGPYDSEADAVAAKMFVDLQQAEEEAEDRLKCRIGMWKAPSSLRMFMFL